MYLFLLRHDNDEILVFFSTHLPTEFLKANEKKIKVEISKSAFYYTPQSFRVISGGDYKKGKPLIEKYIENLQYFVSIVP